MNEDRIIQKLENIETQMEEIKSILKANRQQAIKNNLDQESFSNTFENSEQNPIKSNEINQNNEIISSKTLSNNNNIWAQIKEPASHSLKPENSHTQAQITNPISSNETHWARDFRISQIGYFASKPAAWLGILASICFILAAGFMLKLAIDNGIFTPIMQLGASILFGFSLIFIGFKLYKKDNAYASLLPAVGIAILFISAFASVKILHIASPITGVFFTALVSALCIYIYTRISNVIYPITAALGAYLSPFFLDIYAPNGFSLGYLLFCGISFSAIAPFIKTRSLSLLSSYLTLAIVFLIGGYIQSDAFTFEISSPNLIIQQANLMPYTKSLALFLAVSFIIHLFGAFFFTIHSKIALEKDQEWLYAPALLIFYIIEYQILYAITPKITPIIAMSIAFALLGIYHWAKKKHPEIIKSGDIIIIFSFLILVHSLYYQLTPSGFKPIFLFVGLIFYGLNKDKSYNEIKNLNSIIYIFSALIMAFEYLHVIQIAIMNNSSTSAALNFLIIGAFWFAIINNRNHIKSDNIIDKYLLIAVHILALLTIYSIFKYIDSFAITLMWSIYSGAILIYANRKKDALIAKSTLLILMVSAGKALLIDASSAPNFIRILCLLITGGLLYWSGLYMRRIDSWNQNAETNKTTHQDI